MTPTSVLRVLTPYGGAVRYPALDLGQSDSRNLADACGHGWDRLGARAVTRLAGLGDRRDRHSAFRDVRLPVK
jgi:hypothetical protein